MFQTDKALETNGIKVDYGAFYLRLARAGGANKAYARAMDRLTKPYRRQIQTETIDPEVANRLFIEAYAESVVVGWGMKGEDGQDIEGSFPLDKDTILSFSRENVVRAFEALPDLFTDAKEQASKWTLYRAEVLEKDAGNS
jgi:hypothetical protein